jgi:hypothetical protein
MANGFAPMCGKPPPGALKWWPQRCLYVEVVYDTGAQHNTWVKTVESVMTEKSRSDLAVTGALEGPDIEGSYQGNVNIEVFSVAPGRAPGTQTGTWNDRWDSVEGMEYPLGSGVQLHESGYEQHLTPKVSETSYMCKTDLITGVINTLPVDYYGDAKTFIMRGIMCKDPRRAKKLVRTILSMEGRGLEWRFWPSKSDFLTPPSQVVLAAASRTRAMAAAEEVQIKTEPEPEISGEDSEEIASDAATLGSEGAHTDVHAVMPRTADENMRARLGIKERSRAPGPAVECVEVYDPKVHFAKAKVRPRTAFGRLGEIEEGKEIKDEYDSFVATLADDLDTNISALKAQLKPKQKQMQLMELHKKYGGELVRLAVTRAEPVGPYRGWRPFMPVTQWSLIKR